MPAAEHLQSGGDRDGERVRAAGGADVMRKGCCQHRWWPGRMKAMNSSAGSTGEGLEEICSGKYSPPKSQKLRPYMVVSRVSWLIMLTADVTSH